MLKKLYKQIVTKLNLSQTELEKLRDKLTMENVCAGPFQNDKMMCPNTNALAIKLDVKHFSNDTEIRKYFNQNGITSMNLWMFYILFDLPAMFSKSFTKKSLSVFKTAIDELIFENKF